MIMRKIILFALALASLTSCVDTTTEKAPVEQWVDGLVSQYPNLKSNNLAMASVKDSVAAYGNRAVGRSADLLDGVRFKFVKMIENKDILAVFFDATRCSSAIYVGDNDIYTGIKIRVLGKVDKRTASKLDENKLYAISGQVHAWDDADRFGISHSMVGDIDLGTFILNSDIEIQELDTDQ